MAVGEFVIKVVRGDIVQEKFNSDTIKGIELHNSIVDEYKSKADEIKEQLVSKGFLKATFKEELNKRLLDLGYYHSEERDKSYRYRIPGAQLSAKVIDKKEIGEPEDHFNHTLITYQVNIIVLYTND